MSNLHILPGVERRDMVGDVVPSAEVLQAAIDNGISDVVIVGRRRDGGLFVAGETNDVDRAAGILLRGASYVANGFYGEEQIGSARGAGDR